MLSDDVEMLMCHCRNSLSANGELLGAMTRIKKFCDEAQKPPTNKQNPSASQIADEMHAFVVKHANGEPIYAVAHIERWSRQLIEAWRPIRTKVLAQQTNNSAMVPCGVWAESAGCFIGPGMDCGNKPCQLSRHQ